MWRKFIALLRAAWADALMYRAQVIIWMLTGSTPLVMLAVWATLAEGRTIGTYSGSDFVTYFVGVLSLRQLTGVWIIWDMEHEIRTGELSPYLLRPVHPLLRYLALSLADKPLRMVPVALVCAVAVFIAPDALPDLDALNLVALPLAIVLGFLTYFCMQCCIGLLSFWFTQVIALQDLWFGIYSFTSGYIIPLDLFPPAFTQVLLFLPFRGLLGFQVDLLMGRLTAQEIAFGLAMQLVWLVILGSMMLLIWRRGVRQYSAVGA